MTKCAIIAGPSSISFASLVSVLNRPLDTQPQDRRRQGTSRAQYLKWSVNCFCGVFEVRRDKKFRYRVGEFSSTER